MIPDRMILLRDFPPLKALSLALSLTAMLAGSAVAQQAPAPGAGPAQAVPETAAEREKRQNDLKVLEEAMNANVAAHKPL